MRITYTSFLSLRKVEKHKILVAMNNTMLWTDIVCCEVLRKVDTVYENQLDEKLEREVRKSGKQFDTPIKKDFKGQIN